LGCGYFVARNAFEKSSGMTVWYYKPEEYNLNVDCYGNLKPILKVLHNRVPIRTFEPKTQDVTAGYKIVYGEEVHTMYCSATSIGIIKSRRMICVVCVALIVRSEVHTKFCFQRVKRVGR
jgi:hypothetical protein